MGAVNNRERAYTETQIASPYFLHSCCCWPFCCCWGPAVVQIPSVPGVSTIVLAVFSIYVVLGVSDVVGGLLLFSSLFTYANRVLYTTGVKGIHSKSYFAVGIWVPVS